MHSRAAPSVGGNFTAQLVLTQGKSQRKAEKKLNIYANIVRQILFVTKYAGVSKTIIWLDEGRRLEGTVGQISIKCALCKK